MSLNPKTVGTAVALTALSLIIINVVKPYLPASVSKYLG